MERESSLGVPTERGCHQGRGFATEEGSQHGEGFATEGTLCHRGGSLRGSMISPGVSTQLAAQATGHKGKNRGGKRSLKRKINPNSEANLNSVIKVPKHLDQVSHFNSKKRAI